MFTARYGLDFNTKYMSTVISSAVKTFYLVTFSAQVPKFPRFLSIRNIKSSVDTQFSKQPNPQLHSAQFLSCNSYGMSPQLDSLTDGQYRCSISTLSPVSSLSRTAVSDTKALYNLKLWTLLVFPVTVHKSLSSPACSFLRSHEPAQKNADISM